MFLDRILRVAGVDATCRSLPIGRDRQRTFESLPMVLSVIFRLGPLAAVVLLTVVGCGEDTQSLPIVDTSSALIRGAVDAADRMRVDRDCGALQRAFDTADRNQCTDDQRDYAEAMGCE